MTDEKTEVPFDPFDSNNIDVSNTEIFGCSSEQERWTCRKPNDQTFFRVDPRDEMQMNLPLMKDKSNGEFYLVPKPEMQQELARDMRLVLARCYVTRDNHYGIWPIPHPVGQMGASIFESARVAAKEAESKWLRLVWDGNGYKYHFAEGNIPEPLPCPLSMRDLIEKCFQSHVILNEDHAFFKQLKGL